MATKAEREAEQAATGLVLTKTNEGLVATDASDYDADDSDARTVAPPTVTGCDCVRCRTARGEDPEISSPGGLVTDGQPTSD